MSKAMRIVSILVSIVVILFGLLFAIENPEPLNVLLLTKQFTLPKSMFLVLALGLGVILGGLASLVLVIKYKHVNSKLSRSLRRYESQLSGMKSELDKEPDR